MELYSICALRQQMFEGGVPKLSQGAGQNFVRNLYQKQHLVAFNSVVLLLRHKAATQGLQQDNRFNSSPKVQHAVLLQAGFVHNS